MTRTPETTHQQKITSILGGGKKQFEDEYDAFYPGALYHGRGYKYGDGERTFPPSSLPPTKGSHGGGTGTPSYLPGTYVYAPRLIEVVHPNDQRDRYTLPYECDGWWKVASAIYPPVKDGKDEVMRVPAAACSYTYKEPTFNACVYTAASDYLSSRWGTKLHESDRRWLAGHPLSTDGGVPQEYTLTCVHQLVSAYDMGIARVRIRKGAAILGPQIMAWAMALGCNHLALADRSTSNAAAAQALGMSVEDANKLWRLEFHDEPLPGSIVGERGWGGSTTVQVGSGGGHALYLAPRVRAGDWFVSIVLDRLAAIEYMAPPPNPEYVPRKGAASLLVSDITAPDGKQLAERLDGKGQPASYGTWTLVTAYAGPPVVLPGPVASAEEAVLVSDPSTPIASSPAALGDGASVDEDDAAEFEALNLGCSWCNLPLEHQGPDYPYAYYLDMCDECAMNIWDGYTCDTCKTQIKDPPTPHELLPSGMAVFLCQACEGPITFTREEIVRDEWMQQLVQELWSDDQLDLDVDA